MISVHSPNFVLGLVTGITSITFIALGVVFSIVFGTMGLIFLAIGLLDAAVAGFVLLRGRDKGEPARISHGTAQVVSATHQYGVRISDRHPVKLTVALAGGQYTQTLLAPAHINWQPGEPVQVRYAPDNPANFVPIT